jgi:hypothetical protein
MDSLGAFLNWIQRHQNEMAVNIVAALPLAAFDLLVIVTLLPLAIRFIEGRATRRIRGEALDDVIAKFGGALTSVINTADRLTAWEDGPSRQDRLNLLIVEIENQRANVANELPVFMSTLDPTSVQVAVRMFKAFAECLSKMQMVCRLPPLIEHDPLSSQLQAFDAAFDRLKARRTALLRQEPNPFEQPLAHLGEPFLVAVAALATEWFAHTMPPASPAPRRLTLSRRRDRRGRVKHAADA